MFRTLERVRFPLDDISRNTYVFLPKEDAYN